MSLGANGEEQANNSSIQPSSDGPQVIPFLLYNNHHQSVIFNNSQTLSHHLPIPNTSRERSLHPKTPPKLHHHAAHTRLQRQIQTLPTLQIRRPRRNHRAHLRRDHEPYHIKRPHAVGVSDSHGHVWYCHACEGKLGQDHRSCRLR
jgi:hypothetical protein